MILPDFLLFSRVNQQLKYSGIDSIEHCKNKEHFVSYTHPIDYVYNSRGFRDAEWPESTDELKRAIWCVGDSFTVGIGQPFAHTWTQVLSHQLGVRTINVSMDGASNDWIARKVQRIVEVIDPKNIVVLWSYTHRRESETVRLSDEARVIFSSKDTPLEDDQRWIKTSEQIKQLKPNAVQATIPNFQGTSLEITDPLQWPNNVIYITRQLDWARDYHHFDLLTAQWLVDRVCQRLEY